MKKKESVHTIALDNGDGDILVFGLLVHALMREVCLWTAIAVVTTMVRAIGGGLQRGV